MKKIAHVIKIMIQKAKTKKTLIEHPMLTFKLDSTKVEKKN